MKRIDPLRLRSGRLVGHGRPCFIVAEIGNNHQGSLETAERMVDMAARIGVDAVKFQKRDVESLLTRQGMEAPYTGPNSFGPTYGEHRRALELSIQELATLKQRAEEAGLVFFASAWDQVSLDELLGLDVELLKVCSADLVNLPLVRKCADTGLPVIMSTGMAELTEIDRCVAEFTRANRNLVLLHCNSTYPCPDEEVRLPTMLKLGARYGLNVGYSGHERGLGPSVAAVALGACVLERHLTLDKAQPGTDHEASLDTEEFEDLVKMVRQTEKACRGEDKLVSPAEGAVAEKLRKSIVAAVDIPAGTRLGEEHLTVKSPGTGLSPMFWDEVVGKRLSRDLAADDMLLPEMLLADSVARC